MVTFAQDLMDSLKRAVPSIPPHVLVLLVQMEGRTMETGSAAQRVCAALRFLPDDGHSFENGGKIVGALFEGSPHLQEMHSRIDAGMQWAQNEYSAVR